MAQAKAQEFTEQKGRKIEKITCVIDMENLSFHRHYYWPGIKVGCGLDKGGARYRVCVMCGRLQ